MHFPVLVIVPGEPETAIAHADALLEPFCEDGEWGRDGSRWDWWVVGGRWTGALDGYEPEKDPRNIEVCQICGGTGQRDWTGLDVTPEWIAECNGCNACKGTGQSLKWPTQWVDHPGDIVPIRELRFLSESFVPHAVLTPDGVWHEECRVGLFGCSSDADDGGFHIVSGEGDWTTKVAQLLKQHEDGTVVLVDCHV